MLTGCCIIVLGKREGAHDKEWTEFYCSIFFACNAMLASYRLTRFGLSSDYLGGRAIIWMGQRKPSSKADAVSYVKEKNLTCNMLFNQKVKLSDGYMYFTWLLATIVHPWSSHALSDYKTVTMANVHPSWHMACRPALWFSGHLLIRNVSQGFTVVVSINVIYWHAILISTNYLLNWLWSFTKRSTFLDLESLKNFTRSLPLGMPVQTLTKRLPRSMDL